METLTIIAFLFLVFFYASVVGLGMNLGVNNQNPPGRCNKVVIFSIGALSLVLGAISVYLVLEIGILVGQDHPRTYSDFQPNTVYEVIGEPGSYKGVTGRTDDYLFISEKGHEPKAYRLLIAPPYKYFYVTDKDKKDTVVFHYNEAQPNPKLTEL
jgi:hypothetical protein